MKGKGAGRSRIALAVLALLVVAAAGVYFIAGPSVSHGSKEIVIEVTGADQAQKVYELKTDAEFLSQAMDEAEGLSYSGEEGPYGIMVSEVNDERAVYEEDGAYWSFYVNGEYCRYGIDSQPVADGDEFRIEYTKAE